MHRLLFLVVIIVILVILVNFQSCDKKTIFFAQKTNGAYFIVYAAHFLDCSPQKNHPIPDGKIGRKHFYSNYQN